MVPLAQVTTEQGKLPTFAWSSRGRSAAEGRHRASFGALARLGCVNFLAKSMFKSEHLIP
jgi:hypothetical protein